MEIFDSGQLMSRARTLGNGVRIAQMQPQPSAITGGFVAIDLLEVEPGCDTPLATDPEEHTYYILAGTSEMRRSASGGAAATLSEGSFVAVGAREPHLLANTGSGLLRALVVTPLVVRSERLLGLPASTPVAAEEPRKPGAAEPPARETARRAEALPAPVPASEASEEQEEPAPIANISSFMRRGSELVGQPRPERRRPAPEPEPEPEPEEHTGVTGEHEAVEDEEPQLMELNLVFDGGSRGNPGQGYGSYLVQSPGRRPVIKRVEFGPNYTNNQAEYDTCIAGLEYIIERLTATNRNPSQVALDIKTDSDLVVNQIQGNYKVKEANLRPRHARALELLDQFGEWMISWQPREETVKLLGH